MQMKLKEVLAAHELCSHLLFTCVSTCWAALDFIFVSSIKPGPCLGCEDKKDANYYHSSVLFKQPNIQKVIQAAYKISILKFIMSRLTFSKTSAEFWATFNVETSVNLLWMFVQWWFYYLCVSNTRNKKTPTAQKVNSRILFCLSN